MFYYMTNLSGPDEPKCYRVNTSLVAWVAAKDEEADPVKVEIGFMGGSVLNLKINPQKRKHFLSIIDQDTQNR